MKIFRTVAAGLVLAAAPLTALAQNAPPPGPPPAYASPNPQTVSVMQQTRAQMQQLRAQTRSQMLASLTPAHRTAAANIIGQLALSPSPDPRAAAASLDAVLSPAEKQAIINVENQARTAMRTLHERSRAAIASTLTPEQQSRMQAREQQMEAFRASHPRPNRVPDPGMIALRTLGGFGGWEHGRGHGPDGAPGR